MGDCPDKMHQNHTAQFEYPILKPDEKKKKRVTPPGHQCLSWGMFYRNRRLKEGCCGHRRPSGGRWPWVIQGKRRSLKISLVVFSSRVRGRSNWRNHRVRSTLDQRPSLSGRNCFGAMLRMFRMMRETGSAWAVRDQRRCRPAGSEEM